MSNNTFLPSSISLTTSFQKLSDLLLTAGVITANNPVTGSASYLKNNDASINMLVGQGSVAPTYYATYPPLNAVLIEAGCNTSLIWVKCASSTTTADFVEGAVSYTPPTIDGIIGTITLTDGQVPMSDVSGNLVASSITDDGTTVTVDAEFEATGDAAFGGRVDVTGALTSADSISTTGSLNVTQTASITGASDFGAKLFPTTNDGAALGDATHNFSDFFLASGAIINYANGNVVVAHASGILTISTGELRITTAGTNAISVPTLGSTSTFTNKTLTSPAINLPTVNSGAALGATSTEIDQFNDVSAYQESIIAAGAITVTKKYSGLALVGAGAVTLAAPGATMLGQTKMIEMTADNGDVTLALTNVVGQSSGTTATFNDVGDKLVVMAAASVWVVIKEFGITLS